MPASAERFNTALREPCRSEAAARQRQVYTDVNRRVGVGIFSHHGTARAVSRRQCFGDGGWKQFHHVPFKA